MREIEEIMMTALETIAKQEKDKYELVWECPTFRTCHSLEFFKTYRNDISIDRPFKTTYIEFGTGTGRLVAYLLENGYYAVGMDIAWNSVDPDIIKKWGNHFRWYSGWDDPPPGTPHFDVGVA